MFSLSKVLTARDEARQGHIALLKERIEIFEAHPERFAEEVARLRRILWNLQRIPEFEPSR